MAVSPEILDEYARVGSAFSEQRPNTDLEHFLALILSASLLVEAPPAASQICADPDDDKFFHCALAAGATHIVSGDRHLLDVSGHAALQVTHPRTFMERDIKIKADANPYLSAFATYFYRRRHQQEKKLLPTLSARAFHVMLTKR